MDVKNPFPMTKSTFKNISFKRVLSWVTVNSQTEKYVETIYAHRDGNVEMWNMLGFSK